MNITTPTIVCYQGTNYMYISQNNGGGGYPLYMKFMIFT